MGVQLDVFNCGFTAKDLGVIEVAKFSISETWLTDPRRLDLIERLGNRHLADGLAFECWAIAFQHFREGALIPEKVFIRIKNHEIFVEVGLARKTDAGYYVSGSEKEFEWINRKKEAGKRGGIESGKARRSKPKQKEAKESKPKQNEPSHIHIHSHSHSQNHDHSQIHNSSDGLNLPAAADRCLDLVQPNATYQTWAAYRDAYEQTHKARLKDSPRHFGLCKQIVARVGAESAPDVARFFLTHTDAFYVKAKHPLNLLVRDCEKIFTEMKTGNITTGIEARRVEQTDSIARGIKSYYDKKHGSPQ